MEGPIRQPTQRARYLGLLALSPHRDLGALQLVLARLRLRRLVDAPVALQAASHLAGHGAEEHPDERLGQE
eukprot:9384027-Pyramimonas_sp.AAC.1